MSAMIICTLKECSKSFRQKRSWQKFCSPSHKDRFRWLRRRSRKANKRTQGVSNARTAHFKRVTCKRHVVPGSIRSMLTQIAQLSPDFFLRLADDLRDHKPEAAT